MALRQPNFLLPSRGEDLSDLLPPEAVFLDLDYTHVGDMDGLHPRDIVRQITQTDPKELVLSEQRAPRTGDVMIAGDEGWVLTMLGVWARVEVFHSAESP
jgi:hypothetical protein